jgi:hypothetical protein
MNVVVNLLDGKNLNLSFDPFHTETVKAFYDDLFSKREINAFQITFNNGDVYSKTANV